MRPKKLLLILLSLFFISSSFAQKQTVSGTISDGTTGTPLAGVSVRIKSTKAGTTTNNGGFYKVEAAANDELEISMIGYTSQSIPVGGKTEINIKLEASLTELGQIVLVGTRRPGRVKIETPVPVDVVNVTQASMPTGRMELTSIMNYAAPSLNYNKQSGSDGADHIDLATLRGLGPDQTLVLINGKRRHQTAFVAVFGTRGRGNSGTDLSAIPIDAIDRVEILRDGASAQYGSDAIAGVINIILKKNVNSFNLNMGLSSYNDSKFNPATKKDYEQYIYSGKFDGTAFNFNSNYGFSVGKNGGFINLTLDFLAQGKTFRQALDTNQKSPDYMITNTVRRANGDGSLTSGGFFLNSEFPIANSRTTIYAFGGYNYKGSDAYAFTRNYSARPDRFPTDNNGELINVPGIILTAKDGEQFFNPHIQTHITDASLAAGVRGTTKGDWNWDLSNTIGRNDFHFYGDRTFNASLGSAVPIHFNDGGFNFLQNTFNLNFSKEIPNIAEGFNIAVGAEYRYEQYKLYSGQEASYKNYNPTKTVVNASGDSLTVAGGSQGFPGYQPNDVVNANRSNVAAYVDAEIDVTKRFLIGGAIRLENYSDFGFTSNYKLAMRYKVSNNFNLRGSVSTGFRAPSLQQINFSSTFTTVQGGNIAEVKIAPNYSPITQAAGIPALKQEKSVNASLGFAFKPASEWTITVDGYLVKVKDRVVLSGQFSADDNTLDPQLLSALDSLNVSLAQFFANAVNTTNTGVDVVVEYNKKFNNSHRLKALLTGNLQHMTIDKINVPPKLNDTEDHQKTFLSDREQKFILASAPNAKAAFSLDYTMNKWTFGTRLTYFGKVELLGYGEDGLGINPMVPTDADPNVSVPDRYNYGGKLVTDLYASYSFNKHVSLYGGADNLFNVHPDFGVAPGAKGWAFNNETGGPWDAVQMGGNGMRLFLRLSLNF